MREGGLHRSSSHLTFVSVSHVRFVIENITNTSSELRKLQLAVHSEGERNFASELRFQRILDGFEPTELDQSIPYIVKDS